MTAENAAPSVVIADAGPLIALSRIAHLGLLHDLFGRVWITETVSREILDGGQFADAGLVRQAIAEGWLAVESSTHEALALMTSELDAGELSSITWAFARKEKGLPSLLIVDDAKARGIAAQLKLPVVGTAGVIGRAKLAGLIPQAAALLWQLPQVGYFVAPAVIEAVLRQVGESCARP
jgi:predicted nucleic acid-binding protein